MAEINLLVNDLIIGQESELSFEHIPSVEISLSRCVSDINLNDCEMNINSSDFSKKTFNTIVFDRFFASRGQNTDRKVVGNDRLPNDLELNSLEITDPGKLMDVSKGPGWLQQQFCSNPSLSDIDNTKITRNPRRKHSEPQIICSVSRSLHSILGDLRSIPIQILSTSEDEALVSSNFPVESHEEVYSCGKSPKDLNQMILELSGHRNPEEIFLWVLKDRTNPNMFRLHVIAGEAGSLLGQIRVNEAEFKRAQTEGLFDNFLSLLLLDSVH